MKTFVEEITIVVENCKGCGGTYGISLAYRNYKQEVGGYWVCPYCRQEWGYDPNGSRLVQAQKALKQEQDRAARERAAFDQEKARLNEALQSEKRSKDELLHRTTNGVCPCCNRTFKQLVRHMKSKHPEYATKTGTLTDPSTLPRRKPKSPST